MLQVKLGAGKTVTYKGLAASMPSATATLPGVAGRLRVADVDMDGYPDFVATLSFANSTSTFTKSVILLNQAGEEGMRKLVAVQSGDNSYLG